MAKTKTYIVPAVKKALDVLEYLAGRNESTFHQIFTKLNLPKSTVYNILITLGSRGYVRHVGESKKFGLGWKLVELGNLAISRLDLRTEAMPILRDLVLETNQTSNLGILDGIEGVYILKIESKQYIRLNSWEGKRFPLHCTSLGKVLLAWKDERNIDKILKQVNFTRNTDRTIIDPNELKKHLVKVKERGWALDDQENEPYIRCLGAPVMNITGNVIAAISISGLATQLSDEGLPELSEQLKYTARQLSIKIGNRTEKSDPQAL